MAIPYSTRVCLLHVTFPGSTAALFLGTGEDGVTIEEHPDFAPVMNDLSGPRKPFDMMYCGNEAIVSVTLTRWNEPIHASLAAYGHPNTSIRGKDNPLDRGTLMLTEGKTFMLYVTYPSVAGIIAAPVPPYAAQGLPAGYRFFACHLMAPLRLLPGTRPYKVQMVFHAVSTYSSPSGPSDSAFAVAKLTTAPAQSFALYDHNVGLAIAAGAN